MARFISLASAKGGVGKTTCAINLANALRILGNDTVVVDANHASPHLHAFLSSSSLQENFSLAEALDYKVHPYHAVHRHSSGLKVLPNKKYHDGVPRHRNIAAVLAQLHDYFDFVVVDTSAGLSEDMIAVAALGDNLIVTTPDLVSVAEGIKSKALLERHGHHVHGIIVNKQHGKGFSMHHHDIQNAIGAPLLGVISEDDALPHSAMLRQPVHFSHPDSAAAKQFFTLAQNIIGRQ